MKKSAVSSNDYTKVVAIDAHILTGKYQGSRTWLEGVLRELPYVAPHNHYIIYSNNSSLTRKLCDAPNVTHREMRKWNPVWRLLFFWPFVHTRDKFDVLLTQYVAPPFLAGSQIVVIHDILFETHPHFFRFIDRFRNKLLVRWSARRASRLVTVSSYTKRSIVRQYKIQPKRIFLAPNAVSLTSPAGLRSISKPYVLFVGRIEPRKNLGLLISAMDRVGRPELRLVVVGKLDFKAANELDELNKRPYAIHFEDVEADELAALYCNASVFVFPSRGEGFGIPVLEALSHGIQVVCSSETALPEVAGQFASYFDPGSARAVEDLATAINFALDKPLAFDKMALAAHLAQFSWRRSAEAVASAIEERPTD
jgi:glycosyltransferase involved in cell wall biosynthesis